MGLELRPCDYPPFAYSIPLSYVCCSKVEFRIDIYICDNIAFSSADLKRFISTMAEIPTGAEQSKGEEIYKLNNFNILPPGVRPAMDECLKRHEFIAQFVKETPDSLTMFYATVAYYLATDQASAKFLHLAIDVVANQLKKKE